MKYLAVLGRQPNISIAELQALFGRVVKKTSALAEFTASQDQPVSIARLGGTLKLAAELPKSPLDFLRNLPAGKLTIGLSDYSKNASKKSATIEALKLKKILTRHERSVRIVENKSATLSTATSLHNGLSGKNPRKVELIKVDKSWYKVVGVQDIDAYAHRDQTRPARDAKVGMLPPKLAQILINLCGPLAEGSRILDPFCGTGVVLQEALLMNYRVYGTDLSDRMIEYSKRNLEWLIDNDEDLYHKNAFLLSTGNATSVRWQAPIDAVACECYLGAPMSTIPPEIKLKSEKQTCSTIILGFLKNLSSQIAPNTPVTIAIPAWLRQNGTYSRLEILDEIENLGYNVSNTSRDGLIYCREKQIVARDIIILRKQ